MFIAKGSAFSKPNTFGRNILGVGVLFYGSGLLITQASKWEAATYNRPRTKLRDDLPFLSLCENDDSVFIMTSRKGKSMTQTRF